MTLLCRLQRYVSKLIEIIGEAAEGLAPNLPPPHTLAGTSHGMDGLTQTRREIVRCGMEGIDLDWKRPFSGRPLRKLRLYIGYDTLSKRWMDNINGRSGSKERVDC